MDKENAILLFEKFYQNGYTETEQTLFAMLYVSLISSDTCIDEESCLENLENLRNLEEGLKEANVPEDFKINFSDKITMGISIVERDLKDIRDGNFSYC